MKKIQMLFLFSFLINFIYAQDELAIVNSPSIFNFRLLSEINEYSDSEIGIAKKTEKSFTSSVLDTCFNYNNPVAPADSCFNAPPFCERYLNNFCSINGGYHPDTPGNLQDVFNCTIENNQWLTFMACEPIVSFIITVDDCSVGGGLEFGVFQTDDCMSFFPVQNCISISSGNSATIELNNLSPGINYYFMVDGIDGAICQWQISGLQGASGEAYIQEDITPGSIQGECDICVGSSGFPSDEFPYSVIAPICLYYPLDMDCNGGDLLCSPAPQQFCEPHQDTLYDPIAWDTIWHIDPPYAGHFVNDDSIGSQVDVVWDTTGTFYLEVTIEAVEWDTIPFWNDCIEYCTVICRDGDNCIIERKKINVDKPDDYYFFFEKCPDECVSVQVNSNGGTTSGIPSDTLSQGGAGTIIFCDPGIFEFDAYDNAGCVDHYTVEIFDLQPMDEFVTLEEICPGSCVDFQGSIYCPGFYQIPYIDFNGCLAFIYLDVIEAEQVVGNVFISGETQINCNNQFVTLTADSDHNGQLFYSWSPGGNNISGNSIETNIPGDHTVTAFTDNGCYVGEATITVVEFTDELIELGEIIICEGDCFILEGINYCAEGDYAEDFIDTGTGCTTTYIFKIIIENVPNVVIGPVSEICDGIAENYTVGFNILSIGEVYVDGQTINGNFYQSNPIPSGQPYSFTVHVGNQCGLSEMQVVQGYIECLCITDAGSMSNSLLTLCGSGTINSNFNNDATLDDNDLFSFVLHDQSGNSLGNVLAVNSTGAFNFIPGQMQYGETYYISPIAGNEINGTIDFNSTCFSVGAGQPVIFYEIPSLIINPVNELNCNNPSELIQAEINGGSGIFDFLWIGPGGFQSDSPSVNAEEGGNYSLTVLDIESGCEVSQAIFVESDFEIPSLELNSSGIIDCNNPVAELNAQSDLSDVIFNWTLPSGDNLTGDTLSSNMGGVYSVIATAQNGCKSENIIFQEEDTDTPFLQASDGLIDCNNPVATLSGFSGEPGVNFEWILLNGDTVDEVSITTSLPGDYTVIATGLNGCFSENLVSVDVDTISPSLELIGDEITCSEPSVTLQAITDDSTAMINWIFPTGNETSGDSAITNISGNYTVIVTASNGCTSSSQLLVNNNDETPVFTVNSGEINCEQTMDTLFVNTNSVDVDFTWQLPNGEIISGDTIYTDMPGEFMVTGIALNGCSSEVTAMVIDNGSPPEIEFNFEEINCNNPSVDLAASSNTAGVIFTWTFPNGNNFTGENIMTNLAGEYILTASANNGCSTEEVFEVLENTTPPELEVMSENIYCSNPEATLIASSSDPNVIYTWELPDGSLFNGALLNTDIPGDYSVSVVGLNGCTSYETINVEEVAGPPLIIQLEIEPPQCHGDSNGFIIIGDVFGASGQLIGFINNEPVELPEINNLSAGVFEINIFDENGCEGNVTVELPEPNEVIVNLGDDLFVFNNEQVELNLQSSIVPSTINWSGPAGQAWEGVESISILANESGEYQVTVSDENGCSASDAIYLFVEGSGQVFIPNVFSPNGDDNNDYFTVFSGGDVEEVISFKVFDRWGNMVFSRTNFEPNKLELGWDGTFKSKILNTGVFVYMAEVSFKSGETKKVKGDVVLMD